MRILVDLDGVLCEQCPVGNTVQMALANPITHNIELLRYVKRNNKIVIYTARLGQKLDSKTPSEEAVTKLWLDKHGIPYDSLVFDKPWCDYLVDDRATTLEDLCTKISQQ